MPQWWDASHDACMVGRSNSIYTARCWLTEYKKIITEARGLRRTDAARPGDVVVLIFFAKGKHLVCDAVVTIVYRNTVLQKVASILVYAAK